MDPIGHQLKQFSNPVCFINSIVSMAARAPWQPGPHGAQRLPHGDKEREKKGTIFIDGPSMIIIDGPSMNMNDGFPSMMFIDGCPTMNIDGFPVL